MRTLLAAVAVSCCMLVAAVGCNKNKDKEMTSSTNSPTMASMDVCSHCPGAQHGTADGKCEVCGTKLAAPAK